MDPLAKLLEGARAREAFALRAVMRAPWSLCVEPESPLTLMAGVSGTFWVVPDSGAAEAIGPGDIVIARPAERYIVADAPSRPPTIRIYRGQDCRDLDGTSMAAQMTHGLRTWGNEPDGETVFVVAAYERQSEISERLRRTLPPILTIRKDEWTSPLVGLLCDEIVRDAPGQAAVLDRLVDLLLASALKAWFARDDANRPDWLRSRVDPVVERALKLIYGDPAHAWTMDALAKRSNASRATLSRRFNEIVGEPPMTFLTNHRMALAADLLRQPDQQIGVVAGKVGYQNPFAFSVAFKRVRGINPRAHQLQVGSDGSEAPTAASQED